MKAVAIGPPIGARTSVRPNYNGYGIPHFVAEGLRPSGWAGSSRKSPPRYRQSGKSSPLHSQDSRSPDFRRFILPFSKNPPTSSHEKPLHPVPCGSDPKKHRNLPRFFPNAIPDEPSPVCMTTPASFTPHQPLTLHPAHRPDAGEASRPSVSHPVSPWPRLPRSIRKAPSPARPPPSPDPPPSDGAVPSRNKRSPAAKPPISGKARKPTISTQAAAPGSHGKSPCSGLRANPWSSLDDLYRDNPLDRYFTIVM